MNPYKVLGVSENATKEEIRAAYLKLVKQYHPDKYSDPALKEHAGEKLKEINEAYETLCKPKKTSSSGPSSQSQGGYGAGYGGYGGYGGYSDYGRTYSSYGGRTYANNSYSGPFAEAFQRARACINRNDVEGARAILDGVSVHNGEWYFLYGILHLRRGRYADAREYFRQAAELSPDNDEYRNAFESLTRSGTYSGRGYGPVTGSDNCTFYGWPGAGIGICPTLLCLDLFCCRGCC